MRSLIFPLVLLFQAASAAEVQVYLTAGQSTATNVWASSIKSTLRARAGSQTVEVVPIFRGGASMWQWSWGGVRRDYYTSDLAILRARMNEISAAGDTPVFKGIFWMQGEGETAGNSPTIPLYTSRFLDMLGFYQQDLGLAALPNFIVGVIDANQDPYYDDPAHLVATREQVEQIRAVLLSLGTLPNGSAIDTRPYTRVDAWHLTHDDQIALGAAAANQFFDRFSVPVASSYEVWAGGINFPAGQGDAEDDPDGDGTVNLLEYLCGGDPLAAGVRGSLPVSVVKTGAELGGDTVAGKHYLGLSCRVRKTRPGVSLIPEGAASPADLNLPAAAASMHATGAAVADGEYEIIGWYYQVAIEDGAAGFVRLRAVK